MTRHNKDIRQLIRCGELSQIDALQYSKMLKYANKNYYNSTPSENKLRGWLCNWGVKHTNQAIIGTFIVDILLKDYPVIIELNGGYHQNTVEYDNYRNALLGDMGYTVIVFKNKDLLDKAYIQHRLYKDLLLK